MTINTQKLREAAQRVIEAFGADWYAPGDWQETNDPLPYCDAHHIAAEIARLRTENAGLRIYLRNMIGAYVRLMENGRDRIIDLGGQCDPVDVMEAADPWLRDARAALSGASKC